MSTGKWALILGASSGFGAATARELSREGWNILGVHLDRRSTLALADAVVQDIRSLGRQAHFFNVNAADDAQRTAVLDQAESIVCGTDGVSSPIQCLFHSLAFGTLKSLCGDESVTRSQLEMTLDVMANSLAYWTRDLVKRQLMGFGGRVAAMTSEGAQTVWSGYGAVSAAKSALESHCRQLAVELAPQGITVNAIRAGVTDTAAARKIPGFEKLREAALLRNPFRRLTTPEDVARFMTVLVRPETAWLTGNVLGVDGGESISGFCG